MLSATQGHGIYMKAPAPGSSYYLPSGSGEDMPNARDVAERMGMDGGTKAVAYVARAARTMRSFIL